MRTRYLSLILAAFIAPALGFCSDENLWLMEQDFVKFGKKEAYEKYKKEVLKKDGVSNFSTFAVQADDSMQYTYLIPIKGYCGLGDFLQKRAGRYQSLSSDVKVPYLSTLNFTIESLQQYLPDCSYIPKGKGGFATDDHLYFYLFGITPGNEEIFEDRVRKIAERQQADSSAVCFRSWKIVIGSDIPKYLVAVFAASEKQAQKSAEELQLIDPEMKNALRTQKEGSAILRRDLSTIDLLRH